MPARERPSGPAVFEAIGDRLQRERRAVRVFGLEPLLLADLPVDLVVVLEQQEGADESERAVCALPDV